MMDVHFVLYNHVLGGVWVFVIFAKHPKLQAAYSVNLKKKIGGFLP